MTTPFHCILQSLSGGRQPPEERTKFQEPNSKVVLELGFWFLVFGFWFLVLGSWFLVLGSWFLVLGS
jgi:hypothetical protein